MATILGTIDAGGDGLTVLLALINAKENTNLQMSDFVFSAPIVPTEFNPIRNTKIKLIPKATSGYYGVKTIYYNRIHLSELGPVNVVKGAARTLIELLPAINDKYGVRIMATDIVDYVLPVVATTQNIEVSIVFTAGSVIFYAGDVLTLNGDITAPTFVMDTVLSGVNSVNIKDNALVSSASRLDTFTIAIDVLGTFKNYETNLLTENAFDVQSLSTTIVDNSNIHYAEDIYPFVYMWKDGLLAYGITKNGLVLTTNGDGSLWLMVDKIPPVSKGLLGDSTDPNFTIVAAYNTPLGVYAVMKNISTASYTLFAGTVRGTSWVATTNVVSSMQAFKTNNTLSVEAFDISNGFVNVVVSGAVTTIANGVTYNMPIVETLELATGAYKIKSLADISIDVDKFKLGDPLGNMSQFSFVDGSQGKMLVAFGIVKGTNSPSVIYYDFTNTTPAASFVSSGDIPYSALDGNNTYVNSYSVPLPLTSDGYLDVVEVPIRYKTQTADLGYFIEDNVLTDNEYWTFGIRVYKSIRVGTSRRKWTSTDFKLDARHPSKGLVINNTLGNTHYSIQPSQGISRSKFQWDAVAQDYVVERENLFTFEAAHIYSVISRAAAGDVHAVSIVENPTGLYGDLYGNSSVIGTGFEYSFSLSKFGIPNWAIGSSSNQALLLSDKFSYSAYFGGVPLAVFSDYTSVYALLQNNRGIIKSDDGGVSWSGYAQSNFYAKRDSKTSYTNSNILSITSVSLTPANFIQGVVENGYINTEIDYTADVPVIGFNANVLVSTLSNIATNAIVSFEDTKAKFNPRYPESYVTTQGYVKNINLLGDVVYSGIKAWGCTDIAGTYVLFGSAIQRKATGTNIVTLDSFAIDTPKTVTPITVTRRVGFLDLDYLVSCSEGVGTDTKYHLMATRTTLGVTKPLSLALSGTVGALANFIPTVAMHLWDYMETKYVPYVFYGNRQFLLAGRLDSVDAFNFTLHRPIIPGDTLTPLVPIPMFNANRQEYLFYQTGNGVFKLTYAWDANLRNSVLSLLKLFDTSAWDTPWEFNSGCVRGRGAVTAPTQYELLVNQEITIPGFSFFESGVAPPTPTIDGVYATALPVTVDLVITGSPQLKNDSYGWNVTVTNLFPNKSYTLYVSGQGDPISAYVLTADTNGTITKTGTGAIANNAIAGNYSITVDVQGPNPSVTSIGSDSVVLTIVEPIVLPDVSGAAVDFDNYASGEAAIVDEGDTTQTSGSFSDLPVNTSFIKKIFMSLNGVNITAGAGPELVSIDIDSGVDGNIDCDTNIARPLDYTDVESYLVWIELWDEDNTTMLLTTDKLEFIFI